jgi:hypothetical protein
MLFPQEDFMNSYSMGLTILILMSSMANATFLPGPLINCRSSQVSDAGFSFQVSLDGSNRYQGELTRTFGGYSPMRAYGKEEVVIEQDVVNGSCGIRITQRRDLHGNKLILKIGALNADAERPGHLDFILDGQRASSLFRPQSCYVEQALLNRFCPLNIQGGTYELQTPPAVR